MIRYLIISLACAIFFSPALAQVPGDYTPSTVQMGPMSQRLANMNGGTTFIEEGMKPLTEEDIATFLRVVDTYEKWVREELPALESTIGILRGKEARMQEFSKRSEDMANLVFLSLRVAFAEKISDPKERAEMQKRVAEAQEEMEEAKAQIAHLPEETRQQLLQSIEKNMALLTPAADYPDSSIQLYKKHEKALTSAMKRIESMSERHR